MDNDSNDVELPYNEIYGVSCGRKVARILEWIYTLMCHAE